MDAMSERPAWLGDAGARFVEVLPSHFARLTWDAAQLAGHRQTALRALLRTAQERSPFHRRRLAGLDAGTMTVDRLGELPVMTKAQMMAAFDEVVTDPALRRSGVEAHLAAAGELPTLIDDRFMALASGGSSGLRGIYCYHRDDVPTYVATVLRASVARIASQAGWPLPFRVRLTLVAAPSAMHATAATSPLVAPIAELTPAPATLPFDDLLARVQASDPMLLVGYTGMIARLADAQRQGRLKIQPQGVVVTSEQLTDELRDRIVAGFGFPPSNSFASSEGLQGSAPPGSDVFSFASDLAWLEFVDADDRPVPTGATAHHVLLTHLGNHVQPLIRFRIDDRMTPMPADPGHGHQRARVEGRGDAELRFGSRAVHPLVIRSALLRHRGISAHQMVVGGATVGLRLMADESVDLGRVGQEVGAALRAAGVDVAVTCCRVEALERDGRTGKIRYVAFETPPVPP